MQNIRIEHYNEGDVVTALVPSGEYVAFEQANELVRGYGHSRWAAVADLNKKIEAAGEDRDEDDDERRCHATQEQMWDRARDSRKHEAA